MTLNRLTLLACLPLSLLAACASSSDPQAKAAQNDNMICEQTATLGSNITRRQCYTPEQRAEQKRGVEDFQRAMGAAHKPPSGQ